MLTFFSFLLSLHLGGGVMRGVEGVAFNALPLVVQPRLGRRCPMIQAGSLVNVLPLLGHSLPPLAMAKDSSTS